LIRNFSGISSEEVFGAMIRKTMRTPFCLFYKKLSLESVSF